MRMLASVIGALALIALAACGGSADNSAQPHRG
jgi:hypothetical protein